MSQIENPLTSIGYPTQTLDDIRKFAPAAFTEHKSPNVTNRYSYVPTYELLEAFYKLGWLPTHSRQNGSSPYSRHMIRLNNEKLGYMDLKSDKVKPQIVLDNSHNGMSPAQVHMGLFRLVCTNGLIIAMPGMYTSVRLRHVGIDMKELKELMIVVANQYSKVSSHISEMQEFILDEPQKEEFVIKAIAAREPNVFIKEDGTIDMQKATTIVNPSRILDPIRGEDKKEDLWTVFNVVQERLVKGEFERQTMSGRKTSPKGINNATRHLNFNKVLWTIAEEIMNPETIQA